MARLQPDHCIVAIDIGTTKICVLVAVEQSDGTLSVINMSSVPSHGLSKGVVVDITLASESIKQALAHASAATDFIITHATVGISGAHIHSYNSTGMIPIERGTITERDITAVIAAAQAIVIPENQQILHVIPHHFIVDGQGPLKNPRGMHGVRLEAQVHIVTGSIASVKNIIACCTMAGITVDDVVLEQLASAHATLSTDERMLGVAMIDIGGGTSDIAVYHENALLHTYVVPIAGNHFTRDLAIVLRTTLMQAEQIKKDYGDAFPTKDKPSTATIAIATADGLAEQSVAVHDIHAIVHARAYELLSLIYRNLDKAQVLPFLTTGIVLTGGGSLLHQIDTLAQSIFMLPTRRGMPVDAHTLPFELRSPVYSTAYGLLIQALHKKHHPQDHITKEPLTQRLVQRMKSWIADFF